MHQSVLFNMLNKPRTTNLKEVVLRQPEGSTTMVKSAWIFIYSKLLLKQRLLIRLGILSSVLMTLRQSGLITSTALLTPSFVGFHQSLQNGIK